MLNWQRLRMSFCHIAFIPLVVFFSVVFGILHSRYSAARKVETNDSLLPVYHVSKSDEKRAEITVPVQSKILPASQLFKPTESTHLERLVYISMFSGPAIYHQSASLKRSRTTGMDPKKPLPLVPGSHSHSDLRASHPSPTTHSNASSRSSLTHRLSSTLLHPVKSWRLKEKDPRDNKRCELQQRILKRLSDLHPLERQDRLELYKQLLTKTELHAEASRASTPAGGENDCFSATSAGELSRLRRAAPTRRDWRGAAAPPPAGSTPTPKPSAIEARIASVYRQLHREHPDLFGALEAPEPEIQMEEEMEEEEEIGGGEEYCAFCGDVGVVSREYEICDACLDALLTEAHARRRELLERRKAWVGLEECF
ncbi:hypothetical protein FN846DRAFT_918965 [Sphaerosporella brunnea]|uniref:Uncharacterized protein n=1 Tax=Sphaerosporella brunnea TaxID=1250544 RepID=A0A5J5EXE7_9PEZI|nr:hypothetical protein FN846DRAFT_918965 [Sphaerosporella brunnea]